MNYHISMKHDETSSLENYKGVSLRLPDGTERVFCSTPEVDFMRAFRFLMTTGYELFGEQHEVLLSSSVDNIVTDVPGYWWEDSIIGEMIVSDRWPDVMGLLDYVKQTYRDEY